MVASPPLTSTSAVPSDEGHSRNLDLIFSDTPPERTLLRYFEALNEEDFVTTSMLFVADGVLYPPFESKIVGQEAIHFYLNREAKGIRLFPERKVVNNSDSQDNSEDYQYTIVGAVQTSFFSVNVRWRFKLNSSAEIEAVEVKLLADLKELLTLNRQRTFSTTA